MNRENVILLCIALLVGTTGTTLSPAATLTTYPSEAPFLAALPPGIVLGQESFDGFPHGTVLSGQIPGVILSSPNDGLAGYLPIQAFDAPGATSRPNILYGGLVESSTVEQNIRFSFPIPAMAVAFRLVSQHPVASELLVELEFTDGTSQVLPVVDQDGNNSPGEFLGVTSDAPISAVALASGRVSGGLYQEFGGIDDLKFALEDVLAPICSGAPSRLEGVLGIDGTTSDDRPGDTGIAEVTLDPAAVNLTLAVDPGFTPGVPSTTFRVEAAVPGVDAQGTVIVRDGAGNTCTLCLNLRSLPEGPTFQEVVCCDEGIVFLVSNDDMTPPGTSACGSNPFSLDQPPVPPGYEPSPDGDPSPCTVLTIDSPIAGETEMILKKDGDFDPRLRLLYSRSPDDGLTFPPFSDITELVEPILDIIPDPTKVSGSKQWSVVKVACAIQAEQCNGLDDDGDGLVDEGLPVGDPSVDQDVDGYFLCPPAGAAADCNDQIASINPAGVEACNGLDDDCDGTFDEENPGGGASCVLPDLLGACAEGVTECFEAVLECRQAVTPVAETCDAIDNDCDGSTDEDFPDLGGACSAGVGACTATGSFVCAGDGSGTTCDAVPGEPQPERCDGIDNDCDEATDEDFPDLGGGCSAGIGACATSGSFVCAGDGSGAICDAVPGEPQAERCDTVDNDCDGSTDEDFPDLGGTCSDGVGACAATGSFVCAGDGSGTICTAAPGEPQPEVCDGLDNDCDGATDEAVVFSGYLQPVNQDGSSIFRRNSVIPFKFQLADCAGAPLPPQTATIAVFFYANGIVGSELEDVGSPGKANTDGFYRYDAKAKNYIYNLSTKTLAGNTSYLVRTTLADGSTHDVVISIR